MRQQGEKDRAEQEQKTLLNMRGGVHDARASIPVEKESPNAADLSQITWETASSDALLKDQQMLEKRELSADCRHYFAKAHVHAEQSVMQLVRQHALAAGNVQVTGAMIKRIQDAVGARLRWSVAAARGAERMLRLYGKDGYNVFVDASEGDAARRLKDRLNSVQTDGSDAEVAALAETSEALQLEFAQTVASAGVGGEDTKVSNQNYNYYYMI